MKYSDIKVKKFFLSLYVKYHLFPASFLLLSCPGLGFLFLEQMA